MKSLPRSEHTPTEPCEPRWPRKNAPQAIPTTMADGTGWPRITIVTPSYNQRNFIEGTILSVVRQRYPNLEYIVIDGASTDGSVEVIERYADQLAYWVSEPDRGQADAINKGWCRATGQILAWLNSDDLYTPTALAHVARVMHANPDVRWISGACRYISDTGVHERVYQPRLNGLTDWLTRFVNWPNYSFPQPSVFLRADLFQQVGPLDASMHYSFDHEYWCRIRLAGHTPLLINEILSEFRVHGSSKTSSPDNLFLEEDVAIAKRFCRDLPIVDAWKVAYQVSQTLAHGALWPKSHSERVVPETRRLLQLLRKHPVLVTNRAYWGALRRAVRLG